MKGISISLHGIPVAERETPFNQKTWGIFNKEVRSGLRYYVTKSRYHAPSAECSRQGKKLRSRQVHAQTLTTAELRLHTLIHPTKIIQRNFH